MNKIIIHSKVLIVICIVTCTLLCFGCSKEKRENKRLEDLNGEWEMIFLTDNMPETFWQFEVDSIPKMTQVVYFEYDTISLNASFSVTLDDYKYYLTFDNLDRYLDGKYLILDLDKDILVMERVEWEQNSNPFLRVEFIRIK